MIIREPVTAGEALVDVYRLFLKVYKAFRKKKGSGTSETIDDYQKLDWADFNKDGKADFLIAYRKGWPNAEDLHYEILLSRGLQNVSSGGERGNNQEPERLVLEASKSFLHPGEYDSPKIEGFKATRNMRTLDTEDFTKNGRADFIFYARDWWEGDNVRQDMTTFEGAKHKLDLRVAVNTSEGDDVNDIRFEAHKDYRTKTPKNEVNRHLGKEGNWYRFDKEDSFDVNNDGYADYTHTSWYDGTKRMLYRLRTPTKASPQESLPYVPNN